MADIKIAQLLKAGVHFGHKTPRWNPKMFPYIFQKYIYRLIAFLSNLSNSTIIQILIYTHTLTIDSYLYFSLDTNSQIEV